MFISISSDNNMGIYQQWEIFMINKDLKRVQNINVGQKKLVT